METAEPNSMNSVPDPTIGQTVPSDTMQQDTVDCANCDNPISGAVLYDENENPYCSISCLSQATGLK